MKLVNSYQWRTQGKAGNPSNRTATSKIIKSEKRQKHAKRNKWKIIRKEIKKRKRN